MNMIRNLSFSLWASFKNAVRYFPLFKFYPRHMYYLKTLKRRGMDVGPIDLMPNMCNGLIPPNAGGGNQKIFTEKYRYL